MGKLDNMANIFKKIINIPKAIFRAGKAEVDEVKAFVLTDQDTKRGQRVAFVVLSALRAYGIPVDAEMSKIVEKASAYVIKDIVEGLHEKDNLIVSRVIKELKSI